MQLRDFLIVLYYVCKNMITYVSNVCKYSLKQQTYMLHIQICEYVTYSINWRKIG